MNINGSAIDDAVAKLKGRIARTPMRLSKTLSAITGARIWLKFENQQFTASFKERGALNKLLSLSIDERQAGVIAMSAGNHAQGVAFHARQLAIPTTIVMPEGTPFVKIDNTERLGADVILHGETVDDAADFAHERAGQEGLTFIHPFDDPLIIAGQATIGVEIFEDVPQLDCVIVPIGGGGLISGVSSALKRAKPEIRVFGVEAALYPSAKQTLAGEEVRAGGRTLADGIAVKRPGKLAIPIIKEQVQDIILVDEPLLEEAVLTLLEIEKTVAEGAGAAGLAAVLKDPKRFEGQDVGLIICGGNIDSRLLSDVILRGLVTSSRLLRMAIALPDSPGALAGLTQILAAANANIVEVVHRRAFSGRSIREAIVDVTIEARHRLHAGQIEVQLNEAGYRTKRSGTAIPL